DGSGPKTLAYRKLPVNGEPSGLELGRTAAPVLSTTAIVGVAPSAVRAVALPLFQLSKYRKTPLRAHGVSTVTFWTVRLLLSRPSHRPKKNVLFLMMGPPALIVYWCRLFQSRGVGLQPPVLGSIVLLLVQVLASRALLRTDHTTEPLN